MKKEFKSVTEYVARRVREIAIAGIVFVLSSTAAIAQPQHSGFEIVETTELSVQRFVPSSNPDIEIELSFNVGVSDTSQKMEEAFNKFCARESQASSTLKISFDEIQNGLNSINVDRVSVDGNTEKGTLNIGMLLPDGVVLSVNKRNGLHPKGVVGFNVIHHRQLLISDVMNIDDLNKYILSIQSSDIS